MFTDSDPKRLAQITLVVLLIASINFQLNLGYLFTFMLAGSAAIGMHICHATLRGITLHLKPPQPQFMGTSAALKLHRALENCTQILAIEYLLAAQAFEFLKEQRFGAGTDRAWRLLRETVPAYDQDRWLAPDIAAAAGAPMTLVKRDFTVKVLAEGLDPSAAKKAEKLATRVAAANTFEAVAREFHATQASGWSPRYAARWIERMEKDLFPHIGKLTLPAITAPVLLDALRKVEKRGANETAHTLRQTAGQVFRYAIATGRAERNPAADLSGALDRQAEAMDRMRDGMRALGDAQAEQQRQEQGDGQAQGRSDPGNQRDPLGRQQGESGRIGSDRNLLQGQDVYRRAQDLLDEIRRRFPLDIWLVVGGALAIADQLEKSGLAKLIADWLIRNFDWSATMMAHNDLPPDPEIVGECCPVYGNG